MGYDGGYIVIESRLKKIKNPKGLIKKLGILLGSENHYTDDFGINIKQFLTNDTHNQLYSVTFDKEEGSLFLHDLGLKYPLKMFVKLYGFMKRRRELKWSYATR